MEKLIRFTGGSKRNKNKKNKKKGEETRARDIRVMPVDLFLFFHYILAVCFIHVLKKKKKTPMRYARIKFSVPCAKNLKVCLTYMLLLCLLRIRLKF